MRGARLGAAVAGSRMAAAVESEAMRYKERISVAFLLLRLASWLDCAALPRALRFSDTALRTVAEIMIGAHKCAAIWCAAAQMQMAAPLKPVFANRKRAREVAPLVHSRRVEACGDVFKRKKRDLKTAKAKAELF